MYNFDYKVHTNSVKINITHFAVASHSLSFWNTALFFHQSLHLTQSGCSTVLCICEWTDLAGATCDTLAATAHQVTEWRLAWWLKSRRNGCRNSCRWLTFSTCTLYTTVSPATARRCWNYIICPHPFHILSWHHRYGLLAVSYVIYLLWMQTYSNYVR